MRDKLRLNHVIFNMSFLVALHLGFGSKGLLTSFTDKVFQLQVHIIDVLLQAIHAREHFSTVFTTDGFNSQVAGVDVYL